MLTTESLLLQAFEGTNTKIPVWFMRQAGRYLPSYQKLKEKYTLNEMFQEPELAAKVTCLPFEVLDIDAAIVFSDILYLPSLMGFDIDYTPKGPKIGNLIDEKFAINQLQDVSDIGSLNQTIKIVKNSLKSDIPLIGFAGSPFTVLTYLIEGGSSVSFARTYRWIQENPEMFKQVMQKLTDNTIAYYHKKKEAGIDVFQLFDTWAGILRAQDYANWVLPYVNQILAAIDLPSIYFVRQASHLLALMDKTEADFLSVGENVVLGHHNVITKTKKGVQGNLFNGLLYADDETLKREVRDVLVGGAKHSRFIFNLSHGVFPDVDFKKLQLIVEEVHSFSISR